MLMWVPPSELVPVGLVVGWLFGIILVIRISVSMVVLRYPPSELASPSDLLTPGSVVINTLVMVQVVCNALFVPDVLVIVNTYDAFDCLGTIF